MVIREPESEETMKSALTCSVIAGAAALFVGCGGGVEQPPGSVRAATSANGASTTTQQFHDEIIRFTEPDFCLPQPTTVTWAVTWTLHEVIHFTTHPDGTFSAIDEVSGTTLTVPSDPSQPTYTGPLTFTFESVASSQASVTQFTAEVRATGTDGSTLRFQLIGHLSVSATGATTSFTEGPGRVCTPA